MFKNLEVFQTAMSMAQHAGARQAHVARNIANADTPGYQAQSIPAFREIYRTGETISQLSTRPGHLAGSSNTSAVRASASPSEATPNGNSVSLEEELLNSVEIQREHSRALGIYKHALDLMRLSIGRR